MSRALILSDMPEYPYTLCQWVGSSGAVVVADLAGVAPVDNHFHHVAVVCHSAGDRVYYLDGAKFPMWRWAPYWLRHLAWRYRIWRRGHVKEDWA